MTKQFENTATGEIDICGSPKNIVSNTVTVNEFDISNITLSKKQSCDFVIQGQSLTYTVDINNKNIIPLIGFKLIDNIPNGMKYVTNTFKVNDVQRVPNIAGQILSYDFALLPPGITKVEFDVVLM